jgi:hypothetical protein
MTEQQFDIALVDAIRPLVTETVPRTVAIDAEEFWPRSSGLKQLPIIGTVGAVVVVAFIAVLIGLAAVVGSMPPAPNDWGLYEPQPAGGPLVTTKDGPVSVRRTADRQHLGLVLQRDAMTSVVLATIAEPVPGSNESRSSLYFVACPEETGLEQTYYVFGQANAGPITLHGIRGTASNVTDRMYLIALDAASIPIGKWGFTTETGGGGALGGSALLDLPSYGILQPSGCYVSR